jgi:hypothetical protein
VKKSFLDIWDADTLLPVRSIDNIAVRFWCRFIEKKANSNQIGIYLSHYPDLNPADSKKPKVRGSFYRWYHQGDTTPKFFSTKYERGSISAMEESYPGSLHVLIHPGWILLSGPKSLRSNLFFLSKLDKDTQKLISSRFVQSDSFCEIDTLDRKKQTVANFGQYQLASYNRLLKEDGSLDAFFAFIGLNIEAVLSISGHACIEEAFAFDQTEWHFCDGLDAKLIAALKERCLQLSEAYKKFTGPSVSEEDFELNFMEMILNIPRSIQPK